MVKTRAVLLLSAGILLAIVPRALGQIPSTTLAALGSAKVDERRRAAYALSSMDATSADAVESIGRQLAAFRQSGGPSVFHLMNGLPHPGRAKETDLVELLVQHEPDEAVARALATVCLMRALARVGTVSAVRRLVLVASDAEGAFRTELFRLLKELDERAIAALIEVGADPSPEMRAWAKDVLEALGRRTPGDMVQTSDDQVLVDVLRAYGATRDTDAVPVVLSFVNSARAQVRAVAREATLAYGADAAPKMRATYAALTGERPPSEKDASAEPSSGQNRVDATRLAHALFDAYDHQRLRAVYALLDEGLAKQRAGDIDGAIVDFADVLAREPLLDRRAEIAPAYVMFAQGLEPTSRMRALEYLHRALRLVDGGAQSNHVRSEILSVEGEDLEARGIADTSLFEEALALDPQNTHARSDLERLRTGARARRTREDRVAAGVAAAGGVLIAIGAIAMRAQRQRRRGARGATA